MDIERALRDYLVAEVALVGGRVYPVHLPQTPTYPCLTYTKVSGPRIHALQEDTGLARPRFQVSCWAYDRDNHHTAYSTAKAVAEEVRDALQDFSGVMGGVGGVDVDAVLLENETDLYEHDVRVFQVALDFIIYHQE